MPLCLFTVADKCRKIWFNEVLPDKAIMGHLIRTVLSPDRGSCQVKCYSEPNCVSINVGPLQEGSHKCELNNATAKNQASSILQTRKDYTYLGIEVKCLIVEGLGNKILPHKILPSCPVRYPPSTKT